MKKAIIIILAGLTSFGAMATSTYEEVIEAIKAQQQYKSIDAGDLSQGGGQNAFTDKVASAFTADYAVTLSTAEKNAIIATARAGHVNSASTANYATTAGTASKVATSERNSIISTARSGMGGVSLSQVCASLPKFRTYQSAKYATEHSFVWSGGQCTMKTETVYTGCGTCGGGA